MTDERTIVIRPDLWGKRARVVVLPPMIERPGITLPGRAEAMAFAERLHRETGWAISDEMGEGNHE